MLRTIVFLLALSAGGAAAWLTASVQGSHTPDPVIVEQMAEPAFADILVAADVVAPGEPLDEAALRWQAWPEQAVSPAFVSRTASPDAIERLSGAVARQGFVAGEPIVEEKLAVSGSGFLSVLLPSGRRAVAIRVSAESSAGGFILPNDRVDVLHTRSEGESAGSDSRSVSRTILRNIRVLAIDQSAAERSGESVVGRTATLDLDPRQVEIITAAQASGLISLALRSVADNAEVAPAEPPAAVSQRRTIRVFRAGRAELVTIP